jgi:hypothetical protein
MTSCRPQAGNALTRADANENLTETFTYDALNRVTSATVSQNIAPVKSFAYDAIESISRMSGPTTALLRASYGDHLAKIGLPPRSSTTVNFAAARTVDRSASATEPT